jgi:hypothetical protein
VYLISSRLGHIWFFSIIIRLTQLSQPKGVEIRQWPCIVYTGDRCKVKYCKGEVLITLVLVLDIMPLAVIYVVTYMYSKWLKIKCFIGWPRLSGCIQGTCGFSSVYILKGRAVFLRNKVVVQSFKISALFTVYIGLLVLGTSFTISWWYLSVGCMIYLYNTTQLQSGMCHRRQL